MSIFDLFSKRLRDAEQAGKTDVVQYETIPEPLRRQLRKIAADGLGKSYRSTQYGRIDNELYENVRNVLLREYGRDWLTSKSQTAFDDFMDFMLVCSTVEFLDCTEVVATAIDRVIRKYGVAERDRWKTGNVDELLEEVNYRFRRAGVGYQLAGSKIVRVDSQLLHSEVVKPALSLLNVEGYEGPQEEFLTAYRHLRDGQYKEAIAAASNAFESTMKAICSKKGWEFPANPRASDLIKTLKRNGLLPDYLDRSFDQLAATLSSGLPQVRDSSSAHGQGSEIVSVPEYVAAYSLHLAAAKIVFIVNAAEGSQAG